MCECLPMFNQHVLTFIFSCQFLQRTGERSGDAMQSIKKNTPPLGIVLYYIVSMNGLYQPFSYFNVNPVPQCKSVNTCEYVPVFTKAKSKRTLLSSFVISQKSQTLIISSNRYLCMKSGIKMTF